MHRPHSLDRPQTVGNVGQSVDVGKGGSVGSDYIDSDGSDDDDYDMIPELRPFDIFQFLGFMEKHINTVNWEGKQSQEGKSLNFKQFMRQCYREVKGTKAEPLANQIKKHFKTSFKPLKLMNVLLQKISKMMGNLKKPKGQFNVNEILHEGVGCDECGGMPVIGVRYKCTKCPSYNLCAICEPKQNHSHHNFIKINKPERQVPLEGQENPMRMQSYRHDHIPRTSQLPRAKTPVE